ncbi:MAG: hypothetical protein IKN82_08285 [Treponema sp.]|nr:hypothetical protein [Treponema sp.]
MQKAEIPSYADFKKKYGKVWMLILPIKGYWLQKIWNGEKPEEYRDMTPYYETRLEKYKDFPSFTVGLRAGYSMKSAFAVCLCRLKKGEGFEKWGAEKGKDYYVLQILKVYKEGPLAGKPCPAKRKINN